MIYLARTTIDGTTEIAVLEDAARLKAYQAEGWEVVTYEAWRQACRAACERVYARLRDAAGCAVPVSPPAEQARCPGCRSLRISKQVDGARRCRACEHRWSER